MTEARAPIPLRVTRALTVALLIVVGACGAPDEAENPPASEISAPSGETRPAPPLAQGGEVPSPPVETPIRASSPGDAIRAYYAAIDAGEFARAYHLWGRGGQASGQSYAQFRQGFAATRATEVRLTGPVETEGAAGSLYATVPVEVNAALKDGRRQRFVGQYTLRRVNDVPGASEEQLNWHIESAALVPA